MKSIIEVHGELSRTVDMFVDNFMTEIVPFNVEKVVDYVDRIANSNYPERDLQILTNISSELNERLKELYFNPENDTEELKKMMIQIRNSSKLGEIYAYDGYSLNGKYELVELHDALRKNTRLVLDNKNVFGSTLSVHFVAHMENVVAEATDLVRMNNRSMTKAVLSELHGLHTDMTNIGYKFKESTGSTNLFTKSVGEGA